MLLLFCLLTTTATASELGGPRLPYVSTDDSIDALVRKFDIVWGRLEVVDEVRRTPGSTVRAPGGAVYHPGTESLSFSVFKDARAISWVEFYELVGDQVEADRRARNRTVTYVTMLGGPMLMATGLLAAIFASSKNARYGAVGTMGVGLVALITGFFFFDGDPDRASVEKLIEGYNARLSSE